MKFLFLAAVPAMRLSKTFQFVSLQAIGHPNGGHPRPNTRRIPFSACGFTDLNFVFVASRHSPVKFLNTGFPCAIYTGTLLPCSEMRNGTMPKEVGRWLIGGSRTITRDYEDQCKGPLGGRHHLGWKFVALGKIVVTYDDWIPWDFMDLCASNGVSRELLKLRSSGKSNTIYCI
jgi:hypothetical protein